MNAFFTPETVEDARRFIETRQSSQRPLLIRGSGSRLPSWNYDAISTTNLKCVRFFHPQDMVIGVESGLPFRELIRILAEENMRLPVNPWFQNATVGGAVAANDFGPDRLLGGGFRDFIIGVEYVNGQGKLVKAGGRVVKNVTGYDLSRMVIGSRGGLGLITAVNFKVIPTPTNPYCLAICQKDGQWMQALAEVHRQKIPLDYVQAIQAEGSWRLGLGISGNEARRERIIADLQAVFRDQLRVMPEDNLQHEFACFSPDQRFSGFLTPHLRAFSGEILHLHIIAPGRAFLEQDPNRWTDGANLAVFHPMGGDLHLIYENAPNPNAILDGVAQAVAREGGWLQVERGPESLGKPQIKPLPAGYALMKQLKRGLDPHGIFHAPFYDS